MLDTKITNKLHSQDLFELSDRIEELIAIIKKLQNPVEAMARFHNSIDCGLVESSDLYLLLNGENSVWSFLNQSWYYCGSYVEDVASLESVIAIVVNYELAFRRAELGQLQRFTLMLDESSMIQNEAAKRTKFVLELNPENVVLLSGTPTAGKYERLYSQLRLLGWDISKELYWRQYIETETITVNGFPQKVVVGYKNVDRLKMKLAQYGAVFMKSNDVFDLPEQVFENVMVSPTREYKRFMHASIVELYGIELVGDTTLTKRLYARQLCGHFNKAKLQAFRDLVDSTDDRLIVFYNFYDELHALGELVADRPISVINGNAKTYPPTRAGTIP